MEGGWAEAVSVSACSHSDRQTGRQACRQTDRQTDRQTEGHLVCMQVASCGVCQMCRCVY